ncbi:MAG: TIGR03750 family conjugal transfer protein [Geminicoccaceae bacterium]
MSTADLDHVLGARMNAEPPILRGCSTSELMMVAGAATLFWLPIGIMAAFFLGPVTIALAGGFIVGTIYIGAGVFQRIKRGRPDGYYQHWIDGRLHKLGLRRSSFIVPKEGMLALGRTSNG